MFQDHKLVTHIFCGNHWQRPQCLFLLLPDLWSLKAKRPGTNWIIKNFRQSQSLWTSFKIHLDSIDDVLGRHNRHASLRNPLRKGKWSFCPPFNFFCCQKKIASPVVCIGTSSSYLTPQPAWSIQSIDFEHSPSSWKNVFKCHFLLQDTGIRRGYMHLFLSKSFYVVFTNDILHYRCSYPEKKNDTYNSNRQEKKVQLVFRIFGRDDCSIYDKNLWINKVKNSVSSSVNPGFVWSLSAKYFNPQHLLWFCNRLQQNPPSFEMAP